MTTQDIPSSLQSVAPYITQYGYYAVFALLFIEDFGIPVPGETILIAAAVFAGLGKLNIFFVAIVGFIAAFAGDNLGYLIGKSGGHKLLVQYGKYVFITHERLEKIEEFFEKNGVKVVLVARFIDGLRQVNGILAGMSEMKWRTFALFNAIGAAVWVATWSAVGYFGGNHIDTIKKYIGYFAIVSVLGIIIYILFKMKKNKRKKFPAEPSTD